MIYVWCVIKIFIVDPIAWLAKHRIVLVGVVILIGGAVAYRSCNRTQKPDQPISVEQQTAPSITDAPYVLQTLSSIYYLSDWQQVSDSLVILHRWYEWGKTQWVARQSTVGVPFDKEVQGDYRIYKR